MMKAAGAPEVEPDLLSALQRAADRLALGSAYLAVACLLALTLLTLAEIATAVLSRFIPGLPGGISIAWEYSAYFMGAAFMLGSALTLRAGMQLRVELLLRAGGGRFERPLEFFSSAVSAAFAGFLAWHLAAFAYQSFAAGQVSVDSNTPLWIPQAALAFATGVFALQLLARTLACMASRALDNDAFKVASPAE